MRNRLNKVYDTLNEKMKQQGAVARYLWDCGVAAKKWRMENGLDNTHWFYDPLIFEKVPPLLSFDV